MLALVFPAQSVADPTATISPSAGTTPLSGMQGPTGASIAGWMTPASGTGYTVDWSGLTAGTNYMMVIIADAQTVVLTDTGAQIVANSIDSYNHETFEKVGSAVVTAVVDMTAMNNSEGTNGPPAEAGGMWVSTNAIEWNMEPSEFDANGKPKSFQMTVTGPSGVAGFFKWYWPKALLDLLGFDADDLAGFVDGDQVSATTQTLADGGVLVSINLTYSTHTVTTKKALDISLAASSSSVKKKKKVSLFGWINPKKARKTVKFFRKIKGQKGYKQIGTDKTDSKGYFSRKFPVTQTASYYAQTVKNGKVIKSPVKQVKAKK